MVRATLSGPAGDTSVRLAIDTGATMTVIRPASLVLVGYDPAAAPDRVRMVTASGVEYVPRLSVDRLEALGIAVGPFPVVAYTLPPGSSTQGVLGLNFFRGRRLTLDFRAGWIRVR